MARPRIQCSCGAKMKPIEPEALAQVLQEGLDKLRRVLPTATIRTHLCPKCNKTHIHARL